MCTQKHAYDKVIIESKKLNIYIQLLHFLQYSTLSPPKTHLPKIDRLLYTSTFNRVAFITRNLHFQKYLTQKQWLLCAETIRTSHDANLQRVLYSDILFRQMAFPIPNKFCDVTTQLMTEFCRVTETLRMVKFTHIVGRLQAGYTSTEFCPG